MFSGVDRPSLASDALRELVAVRIVLDSLESQLVAFLRARGSTWIELAEILGVTPQGAGKRHRAAARRVVRGSDRAEPFIPVRRR